MIQSPRGVRPFAFSIAVGLHLAVLAALASQLVEGERAPETAADVSLAPLPFLRPAQPAPEPSQTDPASASPSVRSPITTPSRLLTHPLIDVEGLAVQPAPLLLPAAGPPRAGATGLEGGERAGPAGDSGPAAPGGPAGPLVDPYPGQVLAWLERRRRYPPRASAAGMEGVALVSITLDRRGRLLRARLVRSSGHPLLDEAALAQVREAAPFPAAPADATWSRRRFEAPMTYRLKPARP